MNQELIKNARTCHTKSAWSGFFENFHQEITGATDSKALKEIFRLLREDAQCLLYPPKIFTALLAGCQSSWDLELGKLICTYCKQLSDVDFIIAAAQMYLNCGLPAEARKLSQKALRQTNLTPRATIQLNMAICSSFSEEGLHNKAVKSLSKVETLVRREQLDTEDSASFKAQLARIHFFLGKYITAKELFLEAAELYEQTSNHEQTCRSYINIAACIYNSGDLNTQSAFSYIVKCKAIAERKNFIGYLSHCDSLFGVYAYHHGLFYEALQHMKKALKLAPKSESDYRHLHILSMTAFTYLAVGRYKTARKLADQVIQLSSIYESGHQRTRHVTLEGEILWEEGKALESMKILSNASAPLESRGIHTLEELSFHSRLALQQSFLGRQFQVDKLKISPQLRDHKFNWMTHLRAKAFQYISQNRFAEAHSIYKEMLQTSAETFDNYHACVAQIGKTLTLLNSSATEMEIEEQLYMTEISIAKIGPSPLDSKLNLLRAGSLYRKGRAEETKKLLKTVILDSRTCFVNKFCSQSWLATLSGESPKAKSTWQQELIACQSRILFKPTLLQLSHSKYLISRHWEVDLQKHPLLCELMAYLVARRNHCSGLEDIQTKVWSQSIHLQGWQQKIRNNVRRLRQRFAFTAAPLILQNDELRLFHEAIEISFATDQNRTKEQSLYDILENGPLSSLELSHRLKISQSSVKRILKKKVETEEVAMIRDGRSILYKKVSPQLGDS